LPLIPKRVIGDPTLADAILDRLVHNAHRLTLKGDSLRKATAKRQKLDDEPLLTPMMTSTGEPAQQGDRDRNPWPASIGIGGRLRAEFPADFVGMRNRARGKRLVDDCKVAMTLPACVTARHAWQGRCGTLCRVRPAHHGA
jgi:hypothetical protein